jgi:thioredoxin reductase (NADPH)
MNDRYDIAIVGSGPAGLEAAINAVIRNKKIVVFGSKDLSSKLIKAPKVNNYLGFHNVSGKELKEAFHKHISSMNIEITPERILSTKSRMSKLIYLKNKQFQVIFPNKY